MKKASEMSREKKFLGFGRNILFTGMTSFLTDTSVKDEGNYNVTGTDKSGYTPAISITSQVRIIKASCLHIP